jgi:hypothetical protein
MTENDIREAKEYLTTRQTAYRLTFEDKQPANMEVLADLAWYCKANETCVVKDKQGRIDRDLTLIAEGRREVFLWIMQHLGLTADQMFELYAGRVWRK